MKIHFWVRALLVGTLIFFSGPLRAEDAKPADKPAAEAAPAEASPAVQNRVDELEKLKKENPEKFKKETAERKRKLRQKMNELKEKDPKKFEELKKKMKDRRRQKASHLKKHPKADDHPKDEAENEQHSADVRPD